MSLSLSISMISQFQYLLNLLVFMSLSVFVNLSVSMSMNHSVSESDSLGNHTYSGQESSLILPLVFSRCSRCDMLIDEKRCSNRRIGGQAIFQDYKIKQYLKWPKMVENFLGPKLIYCIPCFRKTEKHPYFFLRRRGCSWPVYLLFSLGVSQSRWSLCSSCS